MEEFPQNTGHNLKCVLRVPYTTHKPGGVFVIVYITEVLRLAHTCDIPVLEPQATDALGRVRRVHT